MQYFCKYTPIEMLKALGITVNLPNHEVDDFSKADALIHNNVCSHARQLLMQASAEESMIVTTCCDSVRCVYDTIRENQLAEEVYSLDLPHTDDQCAVRAYARQLRQFMDAYGETTGAVFDKAAFIRAWQLSAEVWASKMKSLMTQPFIALMGARVSEELLITVRKKFMPLAIQDLTCLGGRDMPYPPADAAAMPLEDLLNVYASALLWQIPCLRMTHLGKRRSLEAAPNLKGLIYHTVRFCDYYEFEYAAVRDNVSVPVLKIETDYTSQTRGQMQTRLAAFAEQFELEKMKTLKQENSMATELEPLYIGIDSGSTTTNIAAVDKNGMLKAYHILRTGAKSGASAARALSVITDKLGRSEHSFGHICSTGYGRDNIDFANSTKTEITCHARGAHAMVPEARTIIDIGGQDSKVICLAADGRVENFIMNDKCAAGTGRFLEMMARTLELEMPEMDRLSLEWQDDLTISSTCTVFAESEVISLIAENKETADIIHGLNKAVAMRTCGLVSRAGGGEPYIMTGGVARNPGLVLEIEKKLGTKLIIPEIPDLAGALGAALFARDAAMDN